MKHAPAVALLAALLAAPGPSSAEIRNTSFRSAALGRDVAVAVQLPPSYDKEPTRRYPVVYVLHGLFESQGFWERRGLAATVDGLWAKGQLPELLVIAVDGGDSFFVNGRSGRYEDMVTQDLVAHSDACLRTLPRRQARGLLGVSMGGYAALRIAFTHPELFAAVATHSAMLLAKPPSQEDGARQWHMEAFHDVFGNPIDPALWQVNDPLALAAKADPKTAPALSFDCGSEDRFGLFAGNSDLHHRLEARGVRHEFGLYPGDHGYEYVLSVFEKSLRFLGEALR